MGILSKLSFMCKLLKPESIFDEPNYYKFIKVNEYEEE